MTTLRSSPPATTDTSSTMSPKGDPPKVPIGALDAIDPDTFDWAAYRGTYKGRALITRLAAIPTLVLGAEVRPSAKALAFARAAALQAIPVLKAETWDVALYGRLCRQIDATLTGGAYDDGMEVDDEHVRSGPEAEGGRDTAWVMQATAAAKAEHQRLSVELNGYLSNLIKESIRLTYLSLAELALKTGNLAEALKCYTQMREYSTGAAHQVQLGLGILEAALMFNDVTPLPGNISKVDASLDRLHPPSSTGAVQVNEDMTATQLAASRENVVRSQAVRRAVTVKFRLARAVLALDDAAYKVAVRELANIDDDGGLGEWEGLAMSSADAAFVAAMCALASQPRDYVRRMLLGRAGFRAALADRPWVLELVRAFVDARYGAALALVRAATPHMLLTPWLAPHAADLAARIRTRALVQYLEPFASVRVAAMADAFAAREDDMFADVCALAERGDIDVRIDAVDRLVVVRERDPRADAFRAAVAAGRDAEASVGTALFRMRLREAGVVVDPTPPQAKETRKEWWRDQRGGAGPAAGPAPGPPAGAGASASASTGAGAGAGATPGAGSSPFASFLPPVSS